MKLNEVDNIYIGDRKVSKIIFRGKTIWGEEKPYLLVSPDMIWVTDIESEIVNVESNTDWQVN